MSSSRLQINVKKKKKNDKFVSNIQKIDLNIKKVRRVSCQENFNEYLFNSTLHGLKYAGDRKINRLER